MAGPRPGPGAGRRPAPVAGALTCRRRLVAMLVTMAVAFVGIAVRLTYVQVVAWERYASVGESQRVRTIPLPGERGAIFDRDGRELAVTVRQPSVVANPRLVLDPAGDAEALSPVLGVPVRDLQERLSRDRTEFVYLARTVSDDVARRVEELGLPGIELVPEPKRFTPAGDLGQSVLGRVGTENEGLDGLELQYERTLAGRPGEIVVEQDPSGRWDLPGGVRSTTPSARGDDVVLTIDRALQYEVERALAAKIAATSARGGVAIVMETGTGEVLALANLLADPGSPPRPDPVNAAVVRVYEPGSVSKLITIAAALEERLVRPADTLLVPATIQVADHVFKEHDPHPTVRWSVTDIMANSSNVGSIMIGQRLGKTRIDAYLRAFGFGQETGLEFPGESRGIMLDPARWSGTSIGTIPIGQGIAVTPMQMLAAYNTVANGGEYVAPRLVRATIDPSGREHPAPEPRRHRVVSPATAAELTEMLNEVVRVGTGTLARIDGYTVAGKTGTARKPREGARGYEEGAYVASFAGFVPSERPALSAIVLLDQPTPIFGGLTSAPVFAEISKWALRHLRIPPPPPADRPVSVPAVDPRAARVVGEPVGGAGAFAAPAATLAPPPPRPLAERRGQT